MSEPVTVQIRDAEPRDLDAVTRLLAQDTKGPRPSSQRASLAHAAALSEILADPRQQILVVDHRLDGVIGVVQVTWIRVIARDGGLYCQVEGIRVDEPHRGHGHGTALTQHIESLAKRHGATRIQLTSHNDRSDAHRFYERAGYEASHVGFKKYL